jgi:hypothetical protein
MKLKDIRAQYYAQTTKASDVARQLSFAGIAAIWVFKTDSTNGPTVPSVLLPAAIAFALALLSDLFQYASGGLLWMSHNFRAERWSEAKNTSRPVSKSPDKMDLVPPREIEHSIKDEDDFYISRRIHWLPRGFFLLKLFAVAAGYILLLLGLATQYQRVLDSRVSAPARREDSTRNSPADVRKGDGTISGPPGAAGKAPSDDTSRVRP